VAGHVVVRSGEVALHEKVLVLRVEDGRFVFLARKRLDRLERFLKGEHDELGQLTDVAP
jgi:hypothetical protein